MQPENRELYRFLAQNGLINSQPYGLFPGGVANCEFSSSAVPMQQSFCGSSSYYSNNNALNNSLEVSGVLSITSTDTTTTPNDRALAALNNHKEAEKRRRERINSHLDKLRSLLPCNSKTDKASLLAKVVERVKELKQQMSEITELETFPSETDEITVLCSSEDDYSSNGRIIFKASLSCEDRPELLPDLIEILKSLHLKTLRAEMATLGGRIRTVLIVAADKDHTIESVPFLQNAFKSLLERSNSSETSKRRRRVLDPSLLV
ncbi:transcription factor bHLH106-like [Argentina anserina]|uniref:transcription factor bHLH106-like n=1 Tax=Argentina anserina TaxID=57926 RepID=UPI002176327D|nr:transcription factor bHLH106-like [Potentilla anserina]